MQIIESIPQQVNFNHSVSALDQQRRPNAIEFS